ncbi:MAG TPA: trypsin-like peptidase domain-containing protein [Acidobacteriota bacterium]|nr:trypsin-like peptidase domain-containing protein [Acidobacteriota bacterium]
MSKQPNKGVFTGRRIFGFLAMLGILALGIGIGTLVTDRVDATADSRIEIRSGGKPVADEAVLSLSRAFEEVSARVGKAVVNIHTQEVVAPREQGLSPEGLESPWDLFDFFGGRIPMPQERLRQSLGSGVIVDPKGYIITNTHVIENATRIRVLVHGGGDYTARVIGADTVSDIAIIKIDGNNDFPYAEIGDSNSMKVGDWVLAIGSPFGLEQTVTAGIISTTGRTIEDGPGRYTILNDYLQTDAAINRGNSGGPLVNMNAEVVGINSFITTTTGASAGIGFAVPSHIFINVYNQILAQGRVSRGYLGVNMNIQPFTPAMAEFFGVKQGYGVLITELADESGPAAKAGIRPEDVVVEFNGNPIHDVQELRLAVANTLPGQKVKIKVIRDRQEKVLDIILAERQFENQEVRRYSFDEKEEQRKPEIGLEFDNIPSNVASRVGISEGAYVTSVSPGSLADDAGMRGAQQGIGDIIVAVNGKPVKNRDDLLAIVRGVKQGEPLVFKYIQSDLLRSGEVHKATFYAGIHKP